ncbi:MAG: hypothetical protein ACPGQC_11245 [Limisphaerales bacterium]
MTDDMGTPKRIDEFYRWNTPNLTYGFDQSFIRFFGEQGIAAVNDAMNVLNDFFVPQDGSYDGVSGMNLTKQGFGGNFNSAWVNGSARQENLIDLKSLTLGIMVNYLGLGNPYRYAFTATNAIIPNGALSGAIFSVALKNYDPRTLIETDVINGVQFSYRLIHDQPAGSVADTSTVGNMVMDLEEFTADTSGNAFSAVSAIPDAFYGNTDIVWTDVPSVFGFGVYYDGMNAMGGMYRPRHGLTYDDAGGLKYLYSTNTIAMEYNPYTLVQPAIFTPTSPSGRLYLPPTGSEAFNRSMQVSPFPVRNGGPLASSFASTHPLSQFGQTVSSTQNTNILNSITNHMNGFGFYGTNVGKMTWAYRGGVDRLQFDMLSYDSLLNMNHMPTNYFWWDTFMTNALIMSQIPSTAQNTTPGASVSLQANGAQFFRQRLGRDVPAPDFLFTASTMPSTTNGLPQAWTRDSWSPGPAPTAGNPAPPAPGDAVPGVPTRWNAMARNIRVSNPVGASGPGTLGFVSGTGLGPGFRIAFNDSFAIGGYEVVWNGEVSVVGGLTTPPVASQQWAYIKGPGPDDYVKFPDGSFSTVLQNSILPVTSAPIIELVSDNGGQSAISPNSLTRTLETLTLEGKHFRTATAIELVGVNSEVVQLIYPVSQYVINDSLIEIPVGVIGYDSEGSNRQVRVWNTIGPSPLSEEKFNIETGPSSISSTSHDGVVFNRNEPLTINGVGFKSKQIGTNDGNATISHIRVDDGLGNGLYPTDGNGSGVNVSARLDVLSDSRAILLGNTLPASTDGYVRVIRVSRGNTHTLSANRVTDTGSPIAFTAVTTEPTVTALDWVNLGNNAETDINATSSLRRDEAIFIRGTGLNTVTSIELVQENGLSYPTPLVAFQEPSNLEENGTLIRLSKYSFANSDADGHGAVRSKLRVINPFGEAIYSPAFNVNIQPNDGTQAANELVVLGGMPQPAAAFNINGKIWNRDADTGEDLSFVGTGLKAIERIYIENANGTALGTEPLITLDPKGTPGVTVTDSLIQIDSSVAQFADANYSDALAKTQFMRFRLDSARNSVNTGGGVTERFLVGRPPKVSSLALSGGGNHWRRDVQASAATLTGTGLKLVDSVEIVDKNGLTILANTGVLLPNSNVTTTSDTSLEINGTAFSVTPGYLDTVTALNRRVRLTTPWGTVLTDDNASGAFTLSATPTFPTTTALTFAGNGSGFNGVDTYDINATTGTAPDNLLPLVINGQNFLGVKTIYFEDNASNLSFKVSDINPAVPPSGITFAADGSQIVISGKVIYDRNSSWADVNATNSRRIVLESVADQNATSQVITTNPAWNDNN